MDDAVNAAPTASDALRALNHTLAAPAAVVGVPDVYGVVGELTVVARQMEHTTRELHRLLVARLAASGLGLSADGTAPVSVDDAVATAVSDLASAGELAGRLAGVLASGQQALASVTDPGTDW